jgi:hypothetical protein
MRKILLVLLIGALFLGGSLLQGVPAAAAADTKPVAVLSLPSYANLMDDVAFVGKLADRPALNAALEGILAMVTQGKGLEGLDKTRPCGVIVQTDGQEIGGYGFLPVSDLKKLLSALQQAVGETKTAEGLTVIQPKNSPKPLYLKEQNGWAYFSDKPAQLAQTLADPSTVLEGLQKRYDVAVRLYPANLPAHLRDTALGQFRQKADRDMEQQKPGESQQDFETRKKVSKLVVDGLVTALKDLDRVTLGWSLDRSATKTSLDLNVTAQAGSPTAAQFAALANTRTAFAGFRLPGAALVGNWAGTIPAAKIEILDTLIDAIHAKGLANIERDQKPAEETRLAKEAVDALAAALQKTVRSAHCDGALAVMLAPDTATALVGGYVADSAVIDKAAKALAELAKTSNPMLGEWITLDAEQFQGVHFHTVSIPIGFDANDRERTVKLIGEKIDVVIGIGKNAFYLAAGRTPLKTLKEAISASASVSRATIPPAQISLAVEPFARFLAVVAKPDDRPKFERMANALKNADGSDHVRLVVSSIPNGANYHLEVEPGLLRMVGQLIANPQGQ